VGVETELVGKVFDVNHVDVSQNCAILYLIYTTNVVQLPFESSIIKGLI
jgi:hypothetical protein